MITTTTLESYASLQRMAPRWVFDSLVWIKATGEDTNDRLSLLEPVIPAGFASPWHVHHTEDELIYVIEGHLTVLVGSSPTSLQPGGYSFGPRGVPHGFRVEGGQPAHLLLLTTGPDFGNLILEFSEPATSPTLPNPQKPDLARLNALAAKYGQEILGPLPE
jgi:quercetin dioxygenase-like cupin family protein